MSTQTLSMTAILVVGMLIPSASAQGIVGNNGQKGSLLVFPRIQVGTAGSGVDTLVTITNDSSRYVLLKCYYATSDPLPTPYTGTARDARATKHFQDFEVDVTHNQPLAWWASTGQVYQYSSRTFFNVAPPFSPMPPGSSTVRTTGELKCWAITKASDGSSTKKVHNDLFGTATLYLGSGQAAGYTAWAFRAAGAAESLLGSPGVLNLDASEYDSCPQFLLGSFHAAGISGPAAGNHTRITLASCNEDLRREKYTPIVTKLTWTFWNQDEIKYTGTRACADSWFETTFPAATWPLAQVTALGTESAYFRIETVADKTVCGASAVTSAYIGVIEHSDSAGNTWATNLTGGGTARGVIKFDAGW